jgi:hypothetical protein
MQGRERELKIAEEFLRDASRGNGGVLLIEGGPASGNQNFSAT